MQMYVRVQFEPAVALRLMGTEIVQNDMHFAPRILGYQFIHEIEKLAPPTARIMPGPDLAGGNVERGKQRSRPVAFVAVAETIDSLSVGQSQIALRSL